nr:hypothetical protein [Gemmatimonadota bacterium]NIR80568.1 hypothetical protein [Gemmatimonadota bacterium]NIT89333.1 hypothetical protein [Gemmatimonadota bacterium]NIU33139.1 hypothetical protein [Gemmatimonadota bacterium]NIU37504.1 hypothetical protein [Gemmatimonadota bacterium]
MTTTSHPSGGRRVRARALGILLAAGAILTGLPASAGAQSLLGMSGLGFPLEPIDARARGMGSLGVGLFGPSLLPGDPAVAQALLIPMVTATLQPSWVTRSSPEEEQRFSTNRFPLLGVAYPFGPANGIATLTFSGYMDQRWEVIREGSVELAGVTVPIIDAFRSEGGISVLRLGWSHRLGEGLAVGATVGSYLGNGRRSFRRTFDAEALGDTATAVEFRTEGEWRYTGPTASLGVSWDATELIRVAGSVIWSGDLHAEAKGERGSRSRDFDLPTEFRIGASGNLGSGLAVNLGLQYADWGGADDDFEDSSTTGAVWSLGGGVEWEGPGFLGRNFPLRAGYRRRGLP